MNNNNMNKRQAAKGAAGSLPIGKNEDVEFSQELADANDFEAQRRAEAADGRQESNE